MFWLRQSTAVVVPFGAIVDRTNGADYESGLASAMDTASTGIQVSKNGGTKADRNGTPTASAYDADGDYKVSLDATDTNTLGTLKLTFSDAACLPHWVEFMIMEQNAWDALYAALGTGTINSNMKKTNDETIIGDGSNLDQFRSDQL